MSLIKEAKLFVKTLRNDKFLYEDAILHGIRKRRAFWGISGKIDSLAHSSVFQCLLIAFFPFLLMMYVIIEFLRTTIRIKNIKKVTLTDDSYFIAATIFSRSINNRINKHIGDACWILNCNDSPEKYEIKSGKYVSCYQLVSVSDALSSGIETIIAYVLICKQYGTFYMLDTINAFTWFLFYRACENIPENSKIFFFDHKDRWAFLENQICCKHKTLIQHGTEIISCSENDAIKRG